ncbi:OmpA family protein [Bradyrhizobium sp. HKCCYLS1011]|uniref:OmpA family protein n=1 Tax=Bradyrhizobium sp. HKCCYLS1011 TaxID=3420733 RepID=UPI003EB75DCE
MLAPPSRATPPSPDGLTQRVPFPRRHAGGINPCAVAGEDAPAWLATAFAIAGTMIAVASAELWLQSASGPIRAAAVTTMAAQRPRPRVERPAESQPAAVPRQDSQPSERPQPPQPADIRPTPALAMSAVAIEPPKPPAASPEAKTTQGPVEPPAPKPTATECFQPLTIAFDHNSARPNPSDVRRSIEMLHRWLPRHGDATVLIDGHSDTTGTEDYNLLLSYARAKAVASELKRGGVPAKQISVRAAGAGETPADARSVAGERSAVLRIAGVEDCGRIEAAKKP